MSNQVDKNLPVPLTQSEDFVAEFHDKEMDLSVLHDKNFIVAVNTGDRNKCKLLASTLTGPYNFTEMVELVGQMYRDHQHHAKVTLLHKEYGKRASFLDAGTTDYLEAHWENVIFESTFESELYADRPLKPGIVEDNGEEDAEEA